MEKTNIRIQSSQSKNHPYYEMIYEAHNPNFFKRTIEMTGNAPVYPPVVVPDPTQEGHYWMIAGVGRYNHCLNKGVKEMDVILYDTVNEELVKKLIVDLNKQRTKSGVELKKEFKHHLEMIPNQKGIKGSDRYALIGDEIGFNRDKVKDFVMLINFFSGDGEVVIDRVFGGELSYKSADQIKKVVTLYPDRFNSETSFDRISQPEFDFTRLQHAVEHLSIDDDVDYELMKSYLSKEYTRGEFDSILRQLGRLKDTQKRHKESQVFVPILDDNFTTANAHIIKGDNRTVDFNNPFGKKTRAFIVSPPYGNKRRNSYDENETGHNMDGEEYGKFLAETFERYKQHMEDDGSLYVIIDDYLFQGEYACSIEYMVVEMRKIGFHLVSRYKWVKNNPLPKPNPNPNSKRIRITNGFEMAYRFVINKNNYYTNPNLFIETEENIKVSKGCVNHSGDGKTTRGGLFVQGNLKKPVNVVSHDVIDDVIRTNVANPDDWFRQADEKYHSSQFPPEIAAFFILESTQEGDLCADFYNGVGNTMVASLLLNRKYAGVEIVDDYYQQTCRKARFYDSEIQQTNTENFEMIAA